MPATEAKVIAYVLAGCICCPSDPSTHVARTYAADVEHWRRDCPIKHQHDLGWYVIRFDERPKHERGSAPRWSCTCRKTKPRADNGGCRHALALQQGRIDEIDNFGDARGRMILHRSYTVKLTAFGYELMHYKWAERALRKAAQG